MNRLFYRLLKSRQVRSARCLCLLFLFTLLPTSALVGLQIDAPHAIAIRAETGRVLYAKNSEQRIYPASTTKVATALYLSYLIRHKDLDIDGLVDVSPEALRMTNMRKKVESDFMLPSYYLEPDGTMLGLRVHEKIPLRTLLMALLNMSSNDAANAMALHACSDIDTFVTGMNAYLRSKGCHQTFFTNPHGLHHPRHYTTTHDLARIFQLALEEPLVLEMMGSKDYLCPYTGRLITQESRFKKAGKFFDERVIASKTGNTAAAGRNLMTLVDLDGRKVILVVNQAKSLIDVYQDTRNLYQSLSEEKLQRRLIYARGDMEYRKEIKGALTPLLAELESDTYLEYYPSEEPDCITSIRWDIPPLPIQKGDLVGFIEIHDKNVGRLQEIPLHAKETVLVRPSLWSAKEGLISSSVWKLSWLLLTLYTLRALHSYFLRREKRDFIERVARD